MIIYFIYGNTIEMQNHHCEKEYRQDVIVEINKLYYEVNFFTIDSLRYEIRADGFFSFPGLIILDAVTTEKIIYSVIELEKLGFFNKLRGDNSLISENRFINSWYDGKIFSYDLNEMDKIEIEDPATFFYKNEF